MRTLLVPRRVLVTLGAVFLLLAASDAHAHTALRRSDPAAGARLERAPATIRLWFRERVQLAVTRVRLVGPGGGETLLALAADPGDSSGVVAAVPASVAAGRWVVRWQTGGRDGHPVRGEFSFVVAAADSATAATAAAGATPNSAAGRVPPRGGAFNATLDSMMSEHADRDPETRIVASGGGALIEYRVARWAEFIGLLAALGAVAFHFLVAAPMRARGHDAAARDASDGARLLGAGALVLALATGLARLHGEAKALGAPDDPLQARAIRDVALGTTWGTGWLIGAVAAVVALLALFLARRSAAGWVLAAVASLGLIATPALTGHANATEGVRLVGVLADALHVAGAGAWLGTLLMVLLAGLGATGRLSAEERGPATAAMLDAYHRVALAGVASVVLSGVVSSVIRVGSWDALTHTSYGSLLLYKVFVFLFVGLVGLYNWKKVLPRIDKADGARKLRRSATVELLVATAVLALTAGLVATQPPE